MMKHKLHMSNNFAGHTHTYIHTPDTGNLHDEEATISHFA